MPLLSITQNLSDDQIIERLSKDLLLLQKQKQQRKKATSIAIFGERTITSEVANAFVNYFHTCAACDDDFVDYFQTCCDGWCASASASATTDGVESTSSSTCLLSSSGQQQQQQQKQSERLNSQERRQRQRRRPRRSKKRRRLFTELDLYCISRNQHFDRIIQTAIQLDLFAKIHIKGTRVSSNNNNNNNNNNDDVVRYIQPSLQVLHDKLQTTKHLHTLQLSYLDLKQHDTIVLKQALSKQHCSLEQLLFTNVHFVNNVVISNDSSSQQQQQESDHHHEEMNDVNTTTDTTTTTITNPSSLQEFINGLNSNTSLKVLALNSCNLNDNDIADIINNGIQCHPTLTQLRLHGNSCRSKGCLSIAKMLSKPNNCKLETLLLHYQFKTTTTTTTTTSNNNNNNNNISEEEEASTTTTRDEINNGQNLVLSTIGLSNLVSKEGWQQQQQQSESESGGGGGGSTKNKTSSSSMIIYRNTSLKKLVLSGNRLRDDDMFSIVHLLRRCINLEELDLDTNYITNDGLKILAENTISNYNLRVLRLSENPIIITQSQHQPTMLLTTNAPPPHFNPTTVRVRVPPVVSSSPSSSQNNQLSTTSKTLYYAKKLLEIHPRLCVLSIGRSHWQWSSSSTTTTTTTTATANSTLEENNNKLIQQIVHLLDCNRAGRILFTSTSTTTTTSTTIGQQHPKHPKQSLKKRPLPMSVWPIALSNINFASPWNWRGSRYTKQNQIYYLLRHGPILMEQRCCYEDKKDNDESNCGRISRDNNSDNNSVVIVDDNNGGSSRISRAAAGAAAAGLKRERQQPEDDDDETTMMKPTNNHHQKKRKAEKSGY